MIKKIASIILIFILIFQNVVFAANPTNPGAFVSLPAELSLKASFKLEWGESTHASLNDIVYIIENTYYDGSSWTAYEETKRTIYTDATINITENPKYKRAKYRVKATVDGLESAYTETAELYINKENANIEVKDLDIGEYIDFGRYLGAEIKWRIIHKEDKDGDGVEEVMLISDRIIDFKEFDAAENGTGAATSILPKVHDAREESGSNDWETSNLREWLNSEAKVNWVTQPPAYKDEKGFLYNLTETEKGLIKPVANKSVIMGPEIGTQDGGSASLLLGATTNPTTRLGNYDDAYYKNITDRVFIPSLKEINDYIYTNTNLIDKATYYDAKPTAEALAQAGTPPITVNDYYYTWIRTPNGSTPSSVSRTSNAAGGTIGTGSSKITTFGVRPAIYIKGDAIVQKGTGIIADSYKLDVRNWDMDYKDVSFKLDKELDYVVLTKFPGMAVDMNNGFEIEMDMKPKFGSRYPTFGNKIMLSGDYTGGKGSLYLSINGGVSDTGRISGSCDYVTGEKDTNNIKIVYDGSSTTFDIYVNGAAQTITYTSQDPFDQLANTDFTREFYLGAGGRYGIPPRYETTMDMSSLKMTANGKVYGDYHFDEGAGDVLYDHSGMGNHGQITGGTWTGENLTSTVKTISTEQVEIGSYMEHGKYHDTPIKWRVINKDENGVMLVSDKVISVKAFDANGDGSEGRTDADRTANGSSYWEKSNLREWLNSINETVNFSHQAPDAPHIITDANIYHLEKGFLTNFSVLENSKMNTSKHKSIVANIDQTEKYGGSATYGTDYTLAGAVSNYDNAYYEIVDEKVTLLSVKEVVQYIYENEMVSDGSEYYKAQKASFLDSNYDTTTDDATHYWLRTPKGDSSRYARNVYSTEGVIQVHSPHFARFGVRPVVYIKYGQDVTGEGTEVDPYKIPKATIGSYVEMGTYNGKPITWRVINNDAETKLLSDKIISMKPFDAKGDVEGDDRLNYGSNNWETSNMREWLNSSDNSVTYIKNAPTNANVYNGVNDYDSEKGFLTNFGQNELNAIRKVTHKSILSGQDMSLADGGVELHVSNQMVSSMEENYNDAYFKYVEDSMYLLSVKEMYEDIYLNSGRLGAGYNKAYPTQEAIDNSEDKSGMYTDSFWHYWLRTPYSYNPYYVRKASINDTSNGSTDAYRGNRGVRPAFNLKDTANLVGSGTLVDPYRVAAETTGQMRVNDYILYSNSVLYKVAVTNGVTVTLESTVDASTRDITGTEMVSGVGEQSSPYIIINKIKPVINVVKPVNNGMFKTNLDIAIDIDYAKVGQNLDVYYKVGAGADTKIETIVSTGNLIEYTQTVTPAVADGTHEIYFWVQDASGNKSTITSKTVVKDSNNLTINAVNAVQEVNSIKLSPVVSNINLVGDSAYKYEYQIDGGTVITSDFSKDAYLLISDIKLNTEYSIDYTITIKDIYDNQIVSSGTKLVKMKAADPSAVEILEIKDTEITLSITASGLNLSMPENKVIMIDEDLTVHESIFTANSKVKMTGLTSGKKYTVKTVTRSTTSMPVINTEIVWTSDILLTKEEVKPEITEFAINYGELLTTSNKVDLKLIATDNKTEIQNLKVQFYVKHYNKNEATGAYEEEVTTGSYTLYGYDSVAKVWRENYIGEYEKYYSNFNLGNKHGKKVVYVKVMDEMLNIEESSSDIVYETYETTRPVIIEDSDKDEVGGVTGENDGKYKEAEGYFLTSRTYANIKVDTKNAKFVQYSTDGVRWSPWEELDSDKIARNVTFSGGDGLKTIYMRTKNEFEVLGDSKILHYMVDMSPPGLKISTATNAYIAVGGTITLVLEITDDVSKSLYYNIEVTDKDGLVQNIGGNKNSGKAIYGSTTSKNVNATVNNLGSGFYTVTITVYDELGNETKKKLNIWSK